MLYVHHKYILHILRSPFTRHTPPWSDRLCTEPSSRLPQEHWKQPPMKRFQGVIWAIRILLRRTYSMTISSKTFKTTSYFPLQVADPVATMPRPTTATASRVVCRNKFKWIQSASTRSGGQHEFWKTATKFTYVSWNTYILIPKQMNTKHSHHLIFQFDAASCQALPNVVNPSVRGHQPLHKHAQNSFLLVEPSLLDLRTCHELKTAAWNETKQSWQRSIQSTMH